MTVRHETAQTIEQREMTSTLTQTDAHYNCNNNDTKIMQTLAAIEGVNNDDTNTAIDSTIHVEVPDQPLTVHNSQLREEQRLDKYTSKIIQYLEQGTLPENNSEAREILLKVDNFFLDDGILYHRTVTRSKRIANLEPLTTQVCVPNALQPVILEHYHDKMAHRGTERTFLSLKKFFYWPRLYESVVEHVRYCRICQVSKSYSLNTSPLRPIGAAGPWDFVQCDCMHVQSSSEGHRYIFVLIDQFTSWPFLFALKQQTSQVIADCILHVTAQVGFFRNLYTDLASTFTSRLLIAVCKTLGITKVSGAAHSSRSHGKIERRLRVIWESLRCLVTSNRDWHKQLTAIELSFRNSPIPGTDITPFEANFGRPMRMPVQTLIIPEAPLGDAWPADIKDYVEDLQQRLKLIQETTAKNREANNELMRNKFDQRFAKPFNYKVGQSVWVKQFAYEPGSSRKLNRPWQEQPYTIETVISPQEVTLRSQETGELLKNKVATNNIKIAYLRSDQLKELEAEKSKSRHTNIDEKSQPQSMDSAEPEAAHDQVTVQETTSVDTKKTISPAVTINDEEFKNPQDPKIDKTPVDNKTGVVVSDQITDDTYYPALRLLACKKISGEKFYKVRWMESETGKRPPDSWSREDDISQALLDDFKKNFTLQGKKRKRKLPDTEAAN